MTATRQMKINKNIQRIRLKGKFNIWQGHVITIQGSILTFSKPGADSTSPVDEFIQWCCTRGDSNNLGFSLGKLTPNKTDNIKLRPPDSKCIQYSSSSHTSTTLKDNKNYFFFGNYFTNDKETQNIYLLVIEYF